VAVHACSDTPPGSDIALSVVEDTNEGYPGGALSYTVQITNTGAVSDTFDLTAMSASGWDTAVMPTTISLDAGESGSFTVSLTIPTGADAGTSDTVTVMAMSQSDPFINASVELTANRS
jgi:uncharacterized membrane protein